MVEEELNCISGKKSSLNRSMLCSDNSLSLIEIILQPKKHFNANFLIVPVVLWLKMHLSFLCVCLTTKPRPSNFRSKYAKILTLFFCIIPFMTQTFLRCLFSNKEEYLQTSSQTSINIFWIKSRYSERERERERGIKRGVCYMVSMWTFCVLVQELRIMEVLGPNSFNVEEIF